MTPRFTYSRFTPSRPIRSALCVLLTSGGIALAAPPDAPTTAPATRPADGDAAARPPARPSPFGGRLLRLRDIGLAGPVWPDVRDESPVTDEQWQEISHFAAEHFPNRWKLFDTLQTRRGVDSPVVKQLRDRIASRCRVLMRLQQSMPELYDAAIEQGRLEDDAWAAVLTARRQPKNTEAVSKMRQSVAALVKNLLQERQDRLETMRQAIKAEQDRLDSDRDDVDGMIDRQIEHLVSDDPGPRRGPFGGFGGGGPGEGRGRWGGEGRWDGRDRGGPTTRP